MRESLLLMTRKFVFSDEHIETACEMRKSNVYSWHLLLREDYLESICSRFHPNWPIYIEDYLETPLGGCFMVWTVTELLMDNFADFKLWTHFWIEFSKFEMLSSKLCAADVDQVHDLYLLFYFYKVTSPTASPCSNHLHLKFKRLVNTS